MKKAGTDRKENIDEKIEKKTFFKSRNCFPEQETNWCLYTYVYNVQLFTNM